MKNKHYPKIEMLRTSIWEGVRNEKIQSLREGIREYVPGVLDFSLVLNCLKELLTHSWNNTLVCTKPNHGIAFPGAGLAIGQEGCIITLPSTVQDSPAKVVEDISLER